MNLIRGLAILLLGVASAQKDTTEAQRPNKHRKWRQKNPPKMVVFGDSNSDTGRGFNAPAAHQYEEYGIGPAPFERLYAASDGNEKIPAYMPFEGSYSNGKIWPTWLRVPDTLEEQITRYFHDIGDSPAETLDYTHVIILGNNDLFHAVEAMTRYSLGGTGYQDPVDFELVFQTDNDTGLPIPSFEPVVEAVVEAWDDGIERLVGAGVTGTILLANMASVKGLSGIINTANAPIFDAVAMAAGLGASQLALQYPQVKILDFFAIGSALVDNPSIFEDLGFIAPEGSFLAQPCILLNFTVDGTAEVMGTQALRHPDCQHTCALCADATSPCQNCLEGNPSMTVCDDPYTRIFYDSIHFSTEFHLVLGEAVRQCSKDNPDFDRPLVSVMCPPEGV